MGPPRRLSPRRRLRGKGLGCAAAAARGEDGLRTQGDSNGILFLGMRERRRGAEPVQKVKKRSGGIASPTSHSYATGLTATPHAASGDRQLERFTNKRVGRGRGDLPDQLNHEVTEERVEQCGALCAGARSSGPNLALLPLGDAQPIA